MTNLYFVAMSSANTFWLGKCECDTRRINKKGENTKMPDAKKRIPRVVLTLKLKCYSLVAEFFIFPYYCAMCLSNISPLMGIDWINLDFLQSEMPNTQLFLSTDQFLINLTDSGSSRTLVSTPQINGLAMEGWSGSLLSPS